MNDMIQLRKMDLTDLTVFIKWLSAPHIAKWYHDPLDWINEVEEQDGEFCWIHHFIVEHKGKPIDFIPNAAIPGVGGIPKTVIFLTADAYGVLPPISKLDKNHRPNALRPGRTSGKDPERGGGSDGDFPILHLPPGKANYGAVETGDLPADL